MHENLNVTNPKDSKEWKEYESISTVCEGFLKQSDDVISLFKGTDMSNYEEYEWGRARQALLETMTFISNFQLNRLRDIHKKFENNELTYN